jgi:hypothetical protein
VNTVPDRKNQPIRTITQVSVSGEWVDLDSLTQVLKMRCAFLLRRNMLREAFAGQVTFEGETPSSGEKPNEKERRS